ncbi:hypothetical protein [Sporosarcina trichiuri]|uniref:hypothetical protein n=1 Tax=Sporosarcina trichiuri TaxID=3056445 RepID=UPI0025B35356|nr:hypothetical protein [Sporosarcina sp. 0.2-SM1T-5]WJY26582.1 hypothetical protein QWT68_10870 [Sporosarcina sp. 0.2-SM1T-5]
MTGSITESMGTAYTGDGIIHKYDHLIRQAAVTVFIKTPPAFALSGLLNELAALHASRGSDIERFRSPLHLEKTDGIYVKDAGILYISASAPVSLEPADLGGRHRVVSFYDVYDEDKLRAVNPSIVQHTEEAEAVLGKALQSLSEAKAIHDEWEAVNIARMDWAEHTAITAKLAADLFGTLRLNKEAVVTHRIIGSLSASGAHDFIPSITKTAKRRILIKSLPGTGKSTMMKALAAEAEKRGIDTEYGWCGLDAGSIDVIQFPELSVCLIDATEPHVYDIEREGDEILNLAGLCAKDELAERKIDAIRLRYKAAIGEAAEAMHRYAGLTGRIDAAMDSALDQQAFSEKSKTLLTLLPV